jgi:hypothetical protein
VADPVRELRNHIAHGYTLFRLAKDGKTPAMTLSLPKDVDATYASETRHLEFRELTNALSELTELIEEFKKLSGWLDQSLDRSRPRNTKSTATTWAAMLALSNVPHFRV